MGQDGSEERSSVKLVEGKCFPEGPSSAASENLSLGLSMNHTPSTSADRTTSHSIDTGAKFILPDRLPPRGICWANWLLRG